jgi:hypothetical protein
MKKWAPHVDALLLLGSLLCAGCPGGGSEGGSTPLPGDGDGDGDGDDPGDGDGDGDGEGDGDTPPGDGDGDACSALLDQAATAFDGAGTLRDCAGIEGGERIRSALLDLGGVTIDNEGTTATPCLALACDDTHAYVASNSLPHYDFVPMTPNALSAVPTLFRIPLTPAPLAPQGTARAATGVLGCQDAYDQFLFAPSTATTQEPSGFCATSGTSYIYDQLETGRSDVQLIPCFSAVALVISGVRVYGPNEAATPDPYGNPGYNYPNDLETDTYGSGAQLDLCGGHVGDAMHYHAAKYACFERDDAGKALFSYDEATAGFDIGAELNDGCSAPSAIVGFAPDGHPIKGPCVCVARAGDGSCTSVRKARSGWVYDGLSSWGADAGESAALGVEGRACASDGECCSAATCHFSCSYTVRDDAGAAGGSTADKRCVLKDYGWCTHRFQARAEASPGDAGFVYMDRCNGFEGPDGYAYHTTFSFPYVLGCFHGQVGATSTWFYEQRAGGQPGAGTGTGGMSPPACTGSVRTMCCGDDVCDGPETATNCPADC